MKQVLILALMLSAHSIMAQATKKVMRAIGQANVEALAEHMDDSIELCILGEPDFVDRQEAVVRIRRFLKRVKPKSLGSIHQGSSKTKGSRYSVANLITENGNFRVFVYAENVGGKKRVREIRFDEE